MPTLRRWCERRAQKKLRHKVKYALRRAKSGDYRHLLVVKDRPENVDWQVT